MKNIAIIPARGGSKRISHKNIRSFCGKPMIKYAIDAALKSRVFDIVMVSTDDAKTAGIAKECGAEVPFMRSNNTSDDFATTLDVLIEVVDEYKKRHIEIGNICCIYPCVPLLKTDILTAAYKKFIESEVDALMSVVKYTHPIQRALKIDRNELLKYNQPEYVKSRSQDLESMYHDAGMFYFYKACSLTDENKKITSFEMKEWEVQDIDTETDWKMAEIKYRALNNV